MPVNFTKGTLAADRAAEIVEAHELAAEQLDTYLTWGEPPAAVAAKVDDITRRAARHYSARIVRKALNLL